MMVPDLHSTLADSYRSSELNSGAVDLSQSRSESNSFMKQAESRLSSSSFSLIMAVINDSLASPITQRSGFYRPPQLRFHRRKLIPTYVDMLYEQFGLTFQPRQD